MTIKIITDSTSDLPEAVIKEYDINSMLYQCWRQKLPGWRGNVAD
jgi:hypothetical protein